MLLYGDARHQILLLPDETFQFYLPERLPPNSSAQHFQKNSITYSYQHSYLMKNVVDKILFLFIITDLRTFILYSEEYSSPNGSKQGLCLYTKFGKDIFVRVTLTIRVKYP